MNKLISLVFRAFRIRGGQIPGDGCIVTSAQSEYPDVEPASQETQRCVGDRLRMQHVKSVLKARKSLFTGDNLIKLSADTFAEDKCPISMLRPT